MARIAIIDDEPAMVEVMATLCRDLGHEAAPFQSAAKALEALRETPADLVITDLRMEPLDGFAVLRALRGDGENSENTDIPPAPAVLMVTGHAAVETAVEAIRLGAFDYITKPFKVDEFQVTVQRALEFQSATRENVSLRHEQASLRHEQEWLRQELREKYRFENIIGSSPRMQQVYRLIAKVADTDSTILIEGESGTGKELVARALHFHSRREARPFVAVNCSALPEALLESELFGHKRGAFTGAVADKTGLFEEAHGGTLFLDEVNSMAPALQTKLLRVLQERVIRRVGETQSVPIDVRVLAATNEPLPEKIRAGAFREDLYYRLAVIPIELPPLRDRLEDIPLLAHHFVRKIAGQTGDEKSPPLKIEPAALEALAAYAWPGNVRELENAIERACALCEKGVIRVHDLPAHVVGQVGHRTGGPQKGAFVAPVNGPALRESAAALPVGQPLEPFVRELERRFIEETIRFTGGSRERAARTLGISLATLYRKLAA